MSRERRSPVEEAASWHVRATTMGSQDWLGFVDWLEATPENAAAYTAVAELDVALAEPLLRAAPKPAHVLPRLAARWRRGWLAMGGLSVAAAAVAWVVIGQQDPIALDRIETSLGKTKIVSLSDGTRIAMNGGTSLIFERSRPRSLRLERGEAFFTIHHDATHPFSVTTGNYTVVDIGTEFNMIASKGALRVQVKSGAVRLDHQRQSFLLAQGRAVAVDEAAGTLTVGAMKDVGSWQRGELFFSNETLPAILAAVERQTGTRISYAKDLSGLVFTGNLKLSGYAARDVTHLAALIGINAQREGEDWVLSTRR